MTRAGLVLGGGGVVGQAYHAGVLTALAHDLGWDPREAEIVVGTSAGSLTGGLLRAGVPAGDLAAWCVDASQWSETSVLERYVGERPHFDPLRWSDLVHLDRVLGLRHVLPHLLQPWRLRPLTMAATLVRPGPRQLQEHLGFLDAIVAEHGEPSGLWICAVRRSDGRRVVFGRGRVPAVRLAAALAASCAVPGYFAPVTIDGVDYVDGGVHSPTNADVLARTDLDLAIVVSPMTASAGAGRDLGAMMRRLCGRWLAAEVATLERAGIPTLCIEPGPDVVRAMGTDLMDDGVVVDVVRESFLDTAAQVQRRPEIAALLDGRRPLLERAG